MTVDDGPFLRNMIDGAASGGLVRSISGVQEVAEWDAIREVHATVADHSDRIIFVVSFSFDDGRTMLLCEVESGWAEVVGALHHHLPIETFEVWGPRILAKPDVYELFKRGNSSVKM